MNCPTCHSASRVLNTDGDDRRRQCTKCQRRFTTTEVLKEDLTAQQRIIADARALAELIAQAEA